MDTTQGPQDEETTSGEQEPKSVHDTRFGGFGSVMDAFDTRPGAIARSAFGLDDPTEKPDTSHLDLFPDGYF